MAFEEHKNKKIQFGNPYADYEYVNKGSKRTWPALVFSLVIGLGLCYLAYYRYSEINMAEIMGDSLSMTSIEWAIYKISGKTGVSVLLVFFGIGLMLLGIYNFKRLERMK
ncbi:MAG: hypothetical protein EOP41_04355 [Sphingobacteriaceae bacterium]|nr:MAG: hypothetical protein EOP41_04355 [Sphingobacteriaceae bacterium]